MYESRLKFPQTPLRGCSPEVRGFRPSTRSHRRRDDAPRAIARPSPARSFDSSDPVVRDRVRVARDALQGARSPSPRPSPNRARSALELARSRTARAPRWFRFVNRNVRASPITSSALARVGRVHGVVATEIAARARAMPRRFAPARALDRASRITRDIFTHVRGRVFPHHFTTPRARSDISRRKISFERSG